MTNRVIDTPEELIKHFQRNLYGFIIDASEFEAHTSENRTLSRSGVHSAGDILIELLAYSSVVQYVQQKLHIANKDIKEIVRNIQYATVTDLWDQRAGMSLRMLVAAAKNDNLLGTGFITEKHLLSDAKEIEARALSSQVYQAEFGREDEAPLTRSLVILFQNVLVRTVNLANARAALAGYDRNVRSKEVSEIREDFIAELRHLQAILREPTVKKRVMQLLNEQEKSTLDDALDLRRWLSWFTDPVRDEPRIRFLTQLLERFKARYHQY